MTSLADRVSRVRKHLIATDLSCQAGLTRVSFELALLQRHSAPAEPEMRNHMGGMRASEHHSGEKNGTYYKKVDCRCEYGRDGDLVNPSMLDPESEIGKGRADVCRFATCSQAAAPECQTRSLGDHANGQDGPVANPG